MKKVKKSNSAKKKAEKKTVKFGMSTPKWPKGSPWPFNGVENT